MKEPSVYILSNKRHGTLYVGVTNNLVRRVYEHKHDMIDGFSKKHQLHILVYYETLDTMQEAIEREKRIKKWRRCWKINLIERHNPAWLDLYQDIH